MRILMVASEAAPYAKTGGLADVLGALPQALAAKGHQVAVVLPLYRTAAKHTTSAEYVRTGQTIWFSPTRSYVANIRLLVDRGVKYYFLDIPELYDRPALYGEAGEDYPDNHIRFAALTRGALAVARHLFRPDIIHGHDWQAGLIGPYLQSTFHTDPTYLGMRNLFTIHNLGYQGIFGRDALTEIGLPDRDLFRPDRMEFWGNISFLKAGIVYADEITTVSKAYAQEIQTPEYGFGMDGLLRSRADRLEGILNGVDYGEWSPETDPHIAAHYSADDLSGKQICKADLLNVFGLPPENLRRPVIGIVSRFASQKGFDLIEQIAPELMSQDVCVVALGTGEPYYEDLMRRLADLYADRFAVRVEFSNGLAHKVEAGADMFLMPSRYEPSGLNQLYSLRYGTVPVVRATGGLDDTIDESTGFKFADYDGAALLSAVRAALDAFADRQRWAALMINGMRRDHSWSRAADEYVQHYQRVLNR
jgi:starch synthase